MYKGEILNQALHIFSAIIVVRQKGKIKVNFVIFSLQHLFLHGNP